MGIITLLLLGIGLAMDAFAVSISNGMCYAGMSKKQSFVNSLCFGVFQGLMPVLGFYAGRLFAGFMQAVDHWIALVLLGFIGGKMLVDGIKELREPAGCPADRTFGVKTMLLQAVATSIDALAVGISLAALSVNIVAAALCIAVITFICCMFGSVLGRRFGSLLGDWAQILGGVILVGIGLKVFIEHMMGG